MSSGSSNVTPPPRPDNRRPTDLRPIHISYDGLARVDGSARFSFGQSTTSLASLSGPIEVRLASELPSKATFEVLVRPLSGIAAIEAKALAAILRACLEPSLILTRNPRTLVQLVVQGLSSPLGPSSLSLSSSSSSSSSTSTASSPSSAFSSQLSLTSSMINASSLSLLIASSIPMRGVVCAVSIALRSDGTLILDPSEDEAASVKAAGAFAFIITTTPGDGAGTADWHGAAGDNAKKREGTLGSRSRYNSDCVWSSWKSISTKGGSASTSTSASALALASDLLQARDLARKGAEDVYAAMRRSFEERRAVVASKLEGKGKQGGDVDVGVKEDGKVGMSATEDVDDEDKMEI